MKRKIVFEDISIFIVKRIFHLRFSVAKLTRKSKICNKIINNLLFKHDATYYIPSDKSVNTLNNTTIEEIDINESIDKPDEIVLPSDIIKEIISTSDDIVIMNSCLCRTSAKCENYPIDLGCVFIGNATKKISRKHCREVSSDEAIEHIDKCSEAGLIHIMGRNRIDSIWMNVRPENELLTICNCCPCCCLWRVYPNLSDEIQDKFYKLSGVSLNFDSSKCVLCLKCVEVCFSDAIKIVDNTISINQDTCIGCGQCSNNCSQEAIKLNYNKKSVNEVINHIHDVVDI